jgi:hypothetical protein
MRTLRVHAWFHSKTKRHASHARRFNRAEHLARVFYDDPHRVVTIQRNRQLECPTARLCLCQEQPYAKRPRPTCPQCGRAWFA